MERKLNIRIGKILFISSDGRILHSIRTGQEFNILVIMESLEEREGWGDEAWVGFWLEIWLDKRRLADWGTGVYKGNFVVYSLTHTSVVFEEPGEHSFHVRLFIREGDLKGDFIEEQTVDFTVRGH